jgi:C4-dicarboxylate-specific signal transduction histidine kinase
MIKRPNLVTRVAIFFTGFMAILLGSATFFISGGIEKWIKTDFAEKTELIALSIANATQDEFCKNDDQQSLKIFFQELLERKEIFSLAINRSEKPILTLKKNMPDGYTEETLVYSTFATIAPCSIKESEAELEIGFSYESLLRPIHFIQNTLALMLATIFIFIMLATVWASRRISARIVEINSVCRAISSGHFDSHETIKETDEFTLILRELHKMNQELKNKKTQTELAQAKLASSAKLSSLGEMAGGIAHEINNPMAIISGRLGQIKKAIENQPPRIEEALVFIQKSNDTVKRVTDIVSGLKLFSRNAEGDPFVRATVAGIVKESLVLTTERFKNESIKIEVSTLDHVEIMCRPTQISQVLINLLNNSADAVAELPEKWIRIEQSEDSTMTILRVTDCGPGIPEKILEKIMEPFFSTKPVGKGTGLGLSVSKGIIESHHGTFEYVRGSKNTSFAIKIPKAKDLAQAA